MNIRNFAAGGLLAVFAAVSAVPAIAQTQNQTAPAAQTLSAEDAANANGLQLAYIVSSSGVTNDAAQTGLEALSAFMTEKTSVEPTGVTGLDIERDEINFYPFIYWPVDQDSAPLSEAAQQKVQHYIDTGGVILFDVQNFDPSQDNNSVLRRMLGGVRLKPMVPLKDTDTLSKTFYILSQLPGSNGPSNTLVEEQDANADEHVSSVIISDGNFAGAWAGMTLPMESRDREMALRSGVDILTYALTGTYKSDLVHVPALLERMGQQP